MLFEPDQCLTRYNIKREPFPFPSVAAGVGGFLGCTPTSGVAALGLALPVGAVGSLG
jgi:hypothetical protein